MSTAHPHHLIEDYLDDLLDAVARREVEDHLAACATCRADYSARRDLLAALQALPVHEEPSRDLWPEIAAQLTPSPAAGRSTERTYLLKDRTAKQTRKPVAPRWWTGIAAVILLLIAIGLFAYERQPDAPGWAVTSLDGTPRIATKGMAKQATLHEGEWLETDAISRAQLDVADIGHVEVAPNTRLQLRRTAKDDQRMALTEGEIEAFIWAPPRLFFVETPAALAVDLGCAYTLKVDSTGTSLLHVTSGYVQLEYEDRETVVPAGAMSFARPGYGPGTAFDQKATPLFKAALLRYDFEGAKDALPTILAEARATDALSLWQLLQKADHPARVYDRLTALIEPPAGTTRQGVLGGDEAMLAAWERHLGLDAPGWMLDL